MADQRVGDLFDKLGVELDISDGDMVTDIVAVAKIIREDGAVTLGIGTNIGQDWILQIGMLQAAREILDGNGYGEVEHDD